jgi:hypothetical protein
MSHNSPLIFEDRRDGRVDAMLGAVPVGAIYPVDHPRNRVVFTFVLPLLEIRMRGARDTERAKRSLTALTEQWLEAAGLRA